MAVVGWYGLLRNGMQLLNSDIQAAKAFARDIDMLQEKLLSQKRALESWKMDWLLSDDAPESMFLELWGEEEYRGIQTRLKNMVKCCNDAEQKLRRFITLKEEKWQTMQKVQKRLYFVFIKSDHLRKLIDTIVTDVDAIETAARRGWQRRNYIRRDGVDFGKVYHIGVGHLLVSIAMRIKRDADAFHLSCRSAKESASIAMDLDIFDHAASTLSAQATLLESSQDVFRASHTAGIARAANDELLAWRIWGQNSVLGATNSVRMRVRRTAEPSHGCPIPPLAFMSIMQGSANQSHFTSEGICFSVAMADDSNRWSPEPPRTLRHILSNNRPPAFADENILGTISKFRVAFELAQACLLLIRTSWFLEICSCHVQCARCSPESSEIKYDFGLQTGLIDHESPTWATMALDTCWGAAGYNWNYLTAPLRRTGLLLIEIIIGAPILRARSDPSGIVTKIDFVNGPLSQLTERSDIVEDVLSRIRSFSNQRSSVKDAVRYCLSEVYPEAPTDDEMRDLLAKFYMNVVEPYGNPFFQAT